MLPLEYLAHELTGQRAAHRRFDPANTSAWHRSWWTRLAGWRSGSHPHTSRDPLTAVGSTTIRLRPTP